MRAHMIAILTLAPLTPACGRSAALTSTVEQPALSREFVLAEGQSVTIANTTLRITFRRAEDSRCPSNVQCVWAGETAVELGLTGVGAAVIDTVGSRASLGDAAYGGFSVRYVDLLPYPAMGRAESPRSVRLVVNRK